jgi:hypothetical protein
VAHQALQALDRALADGEPGVVLGMACPWVRALEPEECLLASTRLTHPPLRRLVRARWKG